MTHLLRKELSELINKQMIISLVVSFSIIMMMSVLMTTMVSQEMQASGTVHLIDRDQTEFTQQIIDRLEEQGYTVEQGEDFEAMAETSGWTEAVVLPAGLTASFERHEAAELESCTLLKTTSAFKMSIQTDGSREHVVSVINELLTEQYLGEEQAFLRDPVTVTPYTYANGKSSQVNAATLVGSLATFDMLMPMVLMLLIVFTSQTIITAIATERADKTLETLLSAPVPRSHIIGAKMLAALIVALIYAVVYGVGFVGSMMLSVGGGDLASTMDVGASVAELASAQKAVEELGLSMSAFGWVGAFAQLALTLFIALTAAIILGALNEDARNAQTAALPIMLCTMFPYILSMVSDIRNMEGALKWLMMAIPFTHTFIAVGCLRFHDYVTFWAGLAYQAVFLAALLWLAVRVYRSDILFVRVRKSKLKQQEKEERSE